MELDILNSQEYLEKISSSDSIKSLEEIRINLLGKNGIIANLMQKLATMSIEDKKEFGKQVNIHKNIIQESIENKKAELELEEIEKKLHSEKIDLSSPVKPRKIGKIHPLTQATEEILTIFSAFGFKIVDGPDIDTEKYNFSSLNFPDHHPAKQMHDTFYMNQKSPNDESKLLRTHTSTMQIRFMEQNKPPFRVVAPGRVYRCDWDITHTPMFHQIEGLVIDKNITMAHLKDFLINFLRMFFENNDVPVRFRPSFFPFTEPSAEVDIGCAWKGKDLVIGDGNNWLEILGCGMVHPNVLANVGIDPNEYQGFALGMGIERLAMLKYGISDLRKFFESDVRWLDHYGFVPFDIPSMIGGLSR